MPKTIIICDDHTLFLAGLTEVLKKFGNNYNVVSFNDAVACKTYLRENTVDVFICDLNIKETDGFLLIDDLKSELRKTKKIILTAYFEDFLIRKASKNGIHAFLKKETSVEELIHVIEMDRDAPFYSNKIQSKDNNGFKSKDESVAGKFMLSKQEKEIIKLIVQGMTSNEIATQLFISCATVDTHRKNIHRKLEISNVSSLIKFANENNLFA